MIHRLHVLLRDRPTKFDGNLLQKNVKSHFASWKRLFRRRSKKTSKLLVTGLCAGNSPVTGEFPPQKASNAENVSIWWRHHEWMIVIDAPVLFQTYSEGYVNCLVCFRLRSDEEYSDAIVLRVMGAVREEMKLLSFDKDKELCFIQVRG